MIQLCSLTKMYPFKMGEKTLEELLIFLNRSQLAKTTRTSSMRGAARRALRAELPPERREGAEDILVFASIR